MTTTETPSSVSGRTELEPLLTIRAVCEMLGVSKPTLYRLINAGHLVPIRIGLSPRFEPNELRRYIDQRRGEVAGP